jgi:hypothetical protein
VLEALRDQLPVVRELPVDPPRRQPDPVDAEHDLVLLDTELDLLRPLADARQLRERARRHDRFQLRDRAFHRRLLD